MTYDDYYSHLAQQGLTTYAISRDIHESMWETRAEKATSRDPSSSSVGQLVQNA
jgi:hypothetical protein